DGIEPSADLQARYAAELPRQYEQHVDLLGAKGRALPGPQPVRVDSHPTGAGGVRVGATTAGRGDPVRRREMLSGMAATATAAVWPWQREPGPAAARASLADLL